MTKQFFLGSRPLEPKEADMQWNLVGDAEPEGARIDAAFASREAALGYIARDKEYREYREVIHQLLNEMEGLSLAGDLELNEELQVRAIGLLMGFTNQG
jgi:hypothetical protein